MLYSKSQMLAFSFCLFLLVFLPVSYHSENGYETISADITAAGFLPDNADEILLNKNAVKFVRAYIQRNNESLVKIKQRSRMPFKTIDRVFKKYHLPVELKYLAVIESELKPTALSGVGAAGPWQLMPGTAKLLGLKVTTVADERTQYNASTRAAALYLRDLYAEFGDWLLVIAAYNCGPKPVYTAIHKSGSRNFWSLQAYLPGESREHVKKFIATHYYFEGQGSATTLTKAENILRNSRAAALAAQKQLYRYASTKVVPEFKKLPVERNIAYRL